MTVFLSATAEPISTKKELLTYSLVLRFLARQQQAIGLDYTPQLQALGFTAAPTPAKLNTRPGVYLLRTSAGLHLSLGAYSKPIALPAKDIALPIRAAA